MKRYMIIANFGNRDFMAAFFDSWSNAQEYIESLNRCTGTYLEVYERRPHGKGEDYTWEYTRIHRYNYGGMTK